MRQGLHHLQIILISYSVVKCRRTNLLRYFNSSTSLGLDIFCMIESFKQYICFLLFYNQLYSIFNYIQMTNSSLIPHRNSNVLQLILQFSKFYPQMAQNQHQNPKQVSLRTQDENLKEKIMTFYTNFVFKLGVIGGMKRVSKYISNQKSNQQTVILGRRCRDQKEAFEHVKNIIWFTYRKNLKIAQDINSDVGWGCLPRVGQMVLAQSLIKFFTSKGIQFNQDLKLSVIEPFIDKPHESANYSLSTILKFARWQYNITPGEWFHIEQISNIIRKIQEVNPMPGSQRLKIILFDQSTIFIDQIIKKIGVSSQAKIQNLLNKRFQKQIIDQNKKNGQQINNNQIIQEKISRIGIKKTQSLEFYHVNNEKKSEDAIGIKIDEQQFQFQNDILIIIKTRLGQEFINKNFYSKILNLLSLKCSLGAIGGVPSKALYIIGFEKNQVLYLDPHYVQQYSEVQNKQKDIQTYFCKKYRKINFESLHPSMAFCFYLRNFDDISLLIHQLNQIKNQLNNEGQQAFIQILDSNPCNQLSAKKVQNKNSFQNESLQFTDISQCI